MAHNCRQIGLMSLGLTVVSSVSSVQLGGISSAVSIILSGLLLFFKDPAEQSKFGRWVEILAHFSSLSVASLGLSDLLDFYDSPEMTVHLVPTVSLPKIMPITIIVVLSLLFSFGLEDAFILQLLTTLLLVCSLAIFSIAGVMSVRWAEPFSVRNDFLADIQYGISLWLPLFRYCLGDKTTPNKEDILISCSIYVLTTTILSSMQKPGSPLSFILPLGNYYPWYKLLQVPVAACCLGMSMYQLYIPTLEGITRQQNILFLSKDNLLTGTKLRANLFICVSSIVLLLIYSVPNLLFISNSAVVVNHVMDFLVQLDCKFHPKVFSRFNPLKKDKVVTEQSYKCLNSCDVNTKDEISDSNDSSDTDIDEAVKEYKEKIKVLGLSTENSSLESVLTVMMGVITTLSFVFTFTLNKKYYWSAAVLAIVITTLVAIVHFNIKIRNSVGTLKNLKLLCHYVVQCVLLSGNSTVTFLPILMWCTLGVISSRYSSWRCTRSRLTDVKPQAFTMKALPIGRVVTKKHIVQTC